MTKWIPVSERLPEQNKDVLVYTITNDIRKAHCYGDRLWFAEDGIWRFVTHWMPLPEPPEPVHTLEHHPGTHNFYGETVTNL